MGHPLHLRSGRQALEQLLVGFGELRIGVNGVALNQFAEVVGQEGRHKVSLHGEAVAADRNATRSFFRSIT